MIVTIQRGSTAEEITLKLLAEDLPVRVLIVKYDPFDPIGRLILTHRRCKSNPTSDTQLLVSALSKQDGIRSYTGQCCHLGEYIGNNPWGRYFARATTYCPVCGYAMEGPVIDWIIWHESSDEEWNKNIRHQCEVAELNAKGINHGVQWDMVPLHRS